MEARYVTLRVGKIIGESWNNKSRIYYVLTRNHHLKFICDPFLFLHVNDIVVYAQIVETNNNNVHFVNKLEDIEIESFLSDYRGVRDGIVINGQYYEVADEQLSSSEINICHYLEKLKKLGVETKEFVSVPMNYLTVDIIQKRKNEIIKVISKLNIQDIIESYTIKIVSGYRSKIRGDDHCWGGFSTECIYHDSYIDKLLPSYNKTLWNDKGYTTALYPSKEEYLIWEEEASNKMREVKQNALACYNKEKHINTLLNSFIKEETAKMLSLNKSYIEIETKAESDWGYFCFYGVHPWIYIINVTKDSDFTNIIPVEACSYNSEQAEQYCYKYNLESPYY